MSLHGTYDPTNIFARMLAGEIPCIRVFEDEVALAFMDIFPQAPGHTLVVPKAVTARNFLDMPAGRIGPYMERVQTVAKAVEKALSPDGMVVIQFNGTPAGQTVFHLHFHVIPRWEGEPLKAHGREQSDPAELEATAKRIRAAF